MNISVGHVLLAAFLLLLGHLSIAAPPNTAGAPQDSQAAGRKIIEDVLRGAGAQRDLKYDASKVMPKIYIYNVSGTYRDSHEAWIWQHTALYGLEITFPVYLMESPYYTTNPDEADYFYVWAYLYYSRNHNVDQLLAEIKKMPYWERKGGKDHIFTIVHDQGLCDNHAYWHALKDSIIIEHWGKPTGVYFSNPCYIFDHWATDCDQVFQMVEAEQRHHHHPRPPPCYKAGKDLLVPTVTSEKPETTRYLNDSMARVPQTTLLVFGGGINQTHLTDATKPENDAGYSFGVRQAFARMFHGDPEIKIFWKMVDDYWAQVHGSIFCLAPAGWGWGSRVKSAITRGCIPVIIQDGIKVEWEDELPMFDFAIRLPGMYLHRLPEILHKYVRTGHAARLQKNLKCVWRLYWWTRPHGRAFEMTMCTLKSRLLGVKLQLDLNTCTLRCGDDKVVDFSKMHSV